MAVLDDGDSTKHVYDHWKTLFLHGYLQLAAFAMILQSKVFQFRGWAFGYATAFRLRVNETIQVSLHKVWFYEWHDLYNVECRKAENDDQFRPDWPSELIISFIVNLERDEHVDSQQYKNGQLENPKFSLPPDWPILLICIDIVLT